MKTYDRLFIGGEWVAPATSTTIEVISPHTEEVIARVPHAAEADTSKERISAGEAASVSRSPNSTSSGSGLEEILKTTQRRWPSRYY